MLVSVLLIGVGFTSLIFGANWLVDGSSALARKFNVSDLVIGLTIVALGTSAPELVVSTIASTNGHHDIVLGNVLGSNNFNLFIILGLSGLVYPIAIQSSTAWKEIPISLAAAAILMLFINDFAFSGNTFLSRWEGGILLILFLVFMYYIFTQTKQEVQDISAEKNLSPGKIRVYIIAGLGGLSLGGHLVVANSVIVASTLGVSDKIIGLTIVAAGTSLPELVTSITAATKGKSDIVVGNVVGSNIFNILLILALSSIVNPIAYNTKFNLDLAILLGGTLFLILAMLTGKRLKLDRWEAGVLVSCYLAYTFYLVVAEAS